MFKFTYQNKKKTPSFLQILGKVNKKQYIQNYKKHKNIKLKADFKFKASEEMEILRPRDDIGYITHRKLKVRDEQQQEFNLAEVRSNVTVKSPKKLGMDMFKLNS
jgi:hypothetical protein